MLICRFIAQHQHQRQPGQALQLVDVLHLRAQVAPQRERCPDRPRADPPQMQRETSPEIPVERRQAQVQHDGQMDRLVGRQCQPQRPVEGIKNPHLAVGQKRRAHEEVRVPEWQPPGLHRPRRLRPVGVEVGEDVAAGQHPPRQRDPPVAGNHQHPKQKNG
ncbi:MAG: hypothetical protein KAX24_10050 [Anaerolineae bacterium]|nr:hypothetical protein [Anaerolineae bacterium]